METPKRILITRTDRLGDVVLSTPVIRHLRRLYPDAYIAMMVKPGNRDVVSSDGHLNEVITYDKYGSDRGLWGMLRFSSRIRGRRFDTAIALHPTNRAHMILFLAGIPRRIGYDRKMPFLLSERYPHTKQEGKMHEVDYNFDLLSRAGFDTRGAERKPHIYTSQEDRVLVDRIMSERGIRKDFIAVHPGSSCPSKRWPPERFAEVANTLTLRTGAQIVLVGGGETEEFSARVLSGTSGSAVDLTGMLTLGELAELLSRSRLFISNDSGPVHVAVAVNTPCVVVFGRKDPGLSPLRWGPRGEGDRIHHKDTGCDVCLAHECVRGFACINAVTSDEVITSAISILEGK